MRRSHAIGVVVDSLVICDFERSNNMKITRK